jgi:hypothetical protein
MNVKPYSRPTRIGMLVMLAAFSPALFGDTIMTYDLSDVTLQGGQAVAGSFLFDVTTGAVTAANITVPADASVGNIPETFDDPNSTTPGGVLILPGHDQILIGNALEDGIVLTLINLNLGTDNTIPLDLVFPYESYVYEGGSGHSYDFIESGSIVATPEPSFFLPSALLLGIGFVTRRRCLDKQRLANLARSGSLTGI